MFVIEPLQTRDVGGSEGSADVGPGPSDICCVLPLYEPVTGNWSLCSHQHCSIACLDLLAEKKQNHFYWGVILDLQENCRSRVPIS